jgi:hypothetical protein
MAGINLTDERRSQLLETLLAQQSQRPQIQSPAELAARLGAQLLRQKKIKKLRQQETESEQALLDALNAGQATPGQAVTLEDFEGGSGREQVFIPGKKADPSASREAVSQLSPTNQLRAFQLEALRKESAEPTRAQAATTSFERERALQRERLDAAVEREQFGITAQQQRDAAQFAQRDKELMARLDADELAQVRKIQADTALLDKKIKAEQAKGGKGFTKAQWKDAGYGVRAAQASAVIDEVGGKFTGFISRGVGVVPEGFRTQDRQRFEQAKRNFVNAILREESGAVISDAEFDNAEKQYFPEPGNKPEVIAQKAQNRATKIATFEQSSGGAFDQLMGVVQAPSTTDDANVVDFSDLPE